MQEMERRWFFCIICRLEDLRGDFYDIWLLGISTKNEEEKQDSSDQSSDIRKVVINLVETTSEDGGSAGFGEHDLHVLIVGDWLGLGLEQLRDSGDELWSDIFVWHQADISIDLVLLDLSGDG